MSHATGFEESGVNDAEGLLAMVHQRYPDVSMGRGREGMGRRQGGWGRHGSTLRDENVLRHHIS